MMYVVTVSPLSSAAAAAVATKAMLPCHFCCHCLCHCHHGQQHQSHFRRLQSTVLKLCHLSLVIFVIYYTHVICHTCPLSHLHNCWWHLSSLPQASQLATGVLEWLGDLLSVAPSSLTSDAPERATLAFLLSLYNYGWVDTSRVKQSLHTCVQCVMATLYMAYIQFICIYISWHLIPSKYFGYIIAVY